MFEELIDFAYKLFERYGVELIGSLLLAFTIGVFYKKSTIKEGLKYLSFAFYALVFKNLILVAFNLCPLVNSNCHVSPIFYSWVSLSFICIASSLFLASALQILHILFSGQIFSVVCSFLLICSGYVIGSHPETASLFMFLPNIYIASAFLIVGISLILIKATRQAHALKSIGVGFILLGIYYAQSVFDLGTNTWFVQALVYLIVLMLSLSSQINLMSIYCNTLEHNLLAEKARRDLILDASPFPVLITRLMDDSVLYINPIAQKLFGVFGDEIASFQFSSYFQDPVKRVELLSRIKRETVIHSFEVKMKNPKTFDAFWLDLSTRIIDLDGELALYTTFKDMTQNKQKEEELFTQASTDPLTGLFNRRQFELLANGQISLAIRHQTPYCVTMLDIDHFKKVNDTYGHDAGDEVLKHLSMVLKSSLRESDILARYGGEEFVIFLPHTSPTEAWRVAERIRESVEQARIQTAVKPLNITVSIGLSSSQNPDLNAQIKEADTALYISKTTGRNKTTLYTKEIQAETNQKEPSAQQEPRGEAEPQGGEQ